MSVDPSSLPLIARHAQLEESLISSYLTGLGYDPQSLHECAQRGDKGARQLLSDASRHASGQLANAECRRLLLEGWHGATRGKYGS
jgi:hypothetical protein